MLLLSGFCPRFSRLFPTLPYFLCPPGISYCRAVNGEVITTAKTNPNMKIAILGNYPPKACGIATFTQSLSRALLANLTAKKISDFAEIIAIEDVGQQHDYPEEVGTILPRDDRAAYRRTADYLNRGAFDLLIVQHEYGIFGGDDGRFLLDLTDRLTIPFMVTCHTVLRQPSEGQRYVMQRLGARAGATIVMSAMAKRFLTEVFGLAADRVHVCEHGVPQITTEDRTVLRERFGWADRKVLFTFGLLGRGKGIETVIRSLPAIVADHPEALYVVLGKTHPNVVRDHGEEYREWLCELAEELGVRDNVRMIAEFASEQYLFECLKAADLYVIPYPNEAQICSGTLAYAVGAGAAVVSTPFWHATELLDEGRGRLFPFHDHDALARTANELLGDEQQLAAVRTAAHRYGQRLAWPVIGEQYIRTFAAATQVFNAPVPLGDKGRSGIRSTPELGHLLRMTDDCGLLQHAKYGTPNRHEGYCLDDNGRALLFTSLALRSGKYSGTDRERLIGLSETYLAYIFHAQNEDGTFRNFMSYGRDFLEDVGSEDSFARALWGLAACVATPPRPDLAGLANECFVRGVGYLDTATSPRTLAYGIIGLSEYLGARPNNDLRDLMDRSVNRLLQHRADHQFDGWDWFENYLSYDNAVLPLALYRSLEVLPREEVAEAAEKTTAWLESITTVGNRQRPVGCAHPFHRDGEPAEYDQQPLEVAAHVLLHAAAYAYHGRPVDAQRARRAAAWFYGHNDLGVRMRDARTTGCFDGLTPLGPNRNQGAESLLALLLSDLTIKTLPGAHNRPEHPIRTLQTMLNGYAPDWVKQSVTTCRNNERHQIVSVTALEHFRREDGRKSSYPSDGPVPTKTS